MKVFRYMLTSIHAYIIIHIITQTHIYSHTYYSLTHTHCNPKLCILLSRIKKNRNKHTQLTSILIFILFPKSLLWLLYSCFIFFFFIYSHSLFLFLFLYFFLLIKAECPKSWDTFRNESLNEHIRETMFCVILFNIHYLQNV